MKILLEDKVSIRNIEIYFSIFQPNEYKSGKSNIKAVVYRGAVKLIKHEEDFLNSTVKNKVTKKDIKTVFEKNKPHYILQIINEINNYDNKRTQRN